IVTSRCNRFPAAVVFVPRTSDAYISASAKTRTSRRPRFAGRQEKCRRSRNPQSIKFIKSRRLFNFLSSEIRVHSRSSVAETPARRIRLDNRYLAPLFITTILVVGHFAYGILESYERTALAIVAALVTELVLGRIFLGKWINLSSAYISGISVGILLRSPALWPFALCSVLSIMSKYVLRVKGRHLWNPSNFRICVLLFFAFALVRSFITGDPWRSEISPITGPMYQLFVFFMITDPKTTVRSKKWQCVVVFAGAFVEMLLRLDHVVYAPLYALFLVGPAAMLIEIWFHTKAQSKATAAQSVA